MARVLIIGYGNPLRGDDGLGWHAAHQCATALPPALVNVIACQQLTPELAEPISQVDLVIFLDADAEELPGRLSCRGIVAQPSEPGVFSHHLTPQTLLTCAQAFYGNSPAAVVLSISGACFGFGECLSPPVSAVIPEVLQRIRGLIAAVEGVATSGDGMVLRREEEGHSDA